MGVLEKLTGNVEGPLLVDGELEIEGTLHGDAQVSGWLDLIGTCEGSIEVLEGGHADVEAAVHGDVRVQGGILRLRGVVSGTLAARRGADVALAVGTIVGGRQLRADGEFVFVQPPVEVQFADDAPMLWLTDQGTWTDRPTTDGRAAGRQRSPVDQ